MSLKIKQVKIAALKPDPKNARIHSPKNIKAIKDSLERFGQYSPLVIEKGKNIVLAGNGTLEAMRELGWIECDVVEFAPGDKSAAAALALADNRTAELGKWDDEMLKDLLGDMPKDLQVVMGWSEKELQRLLAPMKKGKTTRTTQHVCPKCSHEWEA